jgi:hypothetical protein
MVRRRIGAVLGFPVTDEAIERVTVVRGDKLEIDPDRLRMEMRIPDYIDELYELPPGTQFSLAHWHNLGSPVLLGIGFPLRTVSEPPRLYWMTYRSLTRAIRTLTPAFQEAALRHGAWFSDPTA